MQVVERTVNATNSLRRNARWYGGRGLHRLYRMQLPVVSALAKRQLDERSYRRQLVPIAELTQTFSDALDWLRQQRGGDDVEGAYLEFGVCTGSSMIALHEALRTRSDTRLDFIGFDSFEGLPDHAPNDDGGVWKAGSFMSDRARTEARLREHGVEPVLVEGWFSDTLTDDTRSELGIESAPIIMIDCDVYSAAAESLAFCRPHITGPTVIVFDDWNSLDLASRGLGEARAWSEFRQAHPEIVETNVFEPYNANSHVIGVDVRPA